MDLSNKVAIVTGGARDIGRAVSEQLAADGASVAVNYCHSEAGARATVAAIESAGGRAFALKGDMTSRADVEQLVDETRRTYGDSIDILVNVAGGLVARQALAEMDEDFLDAVVKLNLNSAFLTCRQVVAHMGDGGSIINFASQAGRDGGGPGALAYGTAKGAVMTFTRALAKELSDRATSAQTASAPGMISTTFHDTFTKDEVRANVAGTTPLPTRGGRQPRWTRPGSRTWRRRHRASSLARASTSTADSISPDARGGPNPRSDRQGRARTPAASPRTGAAVPRCQRAATRSLRVSFVRIVAPSRTGF